MHDTHMQSCTELSLKAFASCLEAAAAAQRSCMLSTPGDCLGTAFSESWPFFLQSSAQLEERHLLITPSSATAPPLGFLFLWTHAKRPRFATPSATPPPAP